MKKSNSRPHYPQLERLVQRNGGSILQLCKAKNIAPSTMSDVVRGLRPISWDLARKLNPHRAKSFHEDCEKRFWDWAKLTRRAK